MSAMILPAKLTAAEAERDEARRQVAALTPYVVHTVGCDRGVSFDVHVRTLEGGACGPGDHAVSTTMTPRANFCQACGTKLVDKRKVEDMCKRYDRETGVLVEHVTETTTWSECPKFKRAEDGESTNGCDYAENVLVTSFDW